MESGSVLNLEELLNGGPSRLRNIVRFSNAHRVSDESVAEHSFYTAFFTLMIGHELNQFGVELMDVNLAARRALLHDIEESQSGDFIRTFKHSSPELRAAIEKANAAFAQGIFARITKQWQHHHRDWARAKDPSREGRLVAFADYLSVLSYIYGEFQRGNLGVYRDTAESLREYHRKFEGPEFAFLKAYSDQASMMLVRLASEAAR